MILAAGLGTRLRPLTNDRPKALVEINGRTLLEITLTRSAKFGITDFIVNVHHFADKVADYLKAHNNFGVHIEISREDDLLLDTGGGLKKASWFFRDCREDEPFLLHNVDVISNIDLHAMAQFHKDHQALATLAVQSRPTSRPLVFDEQGQFVGRAVPGATAATKGVIPSEARNPGNVLARPNVDPTISDFASSPSLLAFSGIHFLSPRILPLLTETGVFSIIDSYVRLASQRHKILAFRADQYYWRDLGRPADLAQAALDLKQKAFL